MGKRANFTAGLVASKQCNPGKGQTIYWDGKTPGLGLRVTAAGAKSYIFETRLHGRTLRMTIGDVRTWTIAKAQSEATDLKSLTDKGIDPRQKRKEQADAVEARRAEQRSQLVTVGEAWEAYIADRKTRKKKDGRTPLWSERHIKNHEDLVKQGGKKRTRGLRPGEPKITLPGPVYPLLSLKLSDLDAKTMEAWLKKELERGPTQAAQAFRALRAFVGWCADHDEYKGITHTDACTARKVKELAPKVKPKGGDCLEGTQLATWFEWVRKIRNPVISAYLQISLLTGARRDELSGLRWEDVDFQWKSIAIHDKVEGQRIIPLTPYVASLIDALPRRKDEDGKLVPWVFSSPKAASGRLQEPRIEHVKALTAAGLPHVSIHGLRRSFTTLSEDEDIDCPVGVVAQIMGHKPSAIAEKHYKRRSLDKLRLWHVKIERWMLEQAGIEFDADKAKPGLRIVTAA
jgi:integrase